MRSLKSCLVIFGVAVLSIGSALAQLSGAQADSILNYLYEHPIIDRKTAVAQSQELINFYRKTQNDCQWVKSLAVLSRLDASFSEHENAQEHIVKAQRIFDNAKCSSQYQVYINLSISDLQVGLGNFAKSDSILLTTIEMYNKGLQDTTTLIKLLLGVGMGEWELKEIVPYLKRAYRLARKSSNNFLEQKALVELGSTYAMNNEVDTAKYYLRSALVVARKRRDYNNLSVLYNNLAGLAKQKAEVLMYIDSALHYAALDNNLANIQSITENKALFYKRNSDFESAYNTLWSSARLKDSLWNKEKYEAITEMEERYEAEKKENEIKALKLENLNVELEKLTYKKNQGRLVIGSIVFLGLAGFFGYRFVTVRRNRNVLAGKNHELFKAHQRSDELLLNILPAEIAQELKEKGKAEAKLIDMATILFTDLIEFTRTATDMDTGELVEELNYCFKGFDEIMEKYGIEKIKTIGDAYMAVGGLPIPSEGSVRNTVLAAIEMQTFIATRKKHQDARQRISFEMRAGIHTGPVVAGIVGLKKFQYDIWGDAVNTANRLESTGLSGQVNISQDTYDHIKDDPAFRFTSRGKIQAKGKGQIAMYFVRLAV